MKRALQTLLTLTLVVLALTVSTFAANFSDTANHWAESSIDRWSGYEVVGGKGEGAFDPNGRMLRAEAAQVFANLFGLNKVGDISDFGDVDEDSWYYNALAKCFAARVMLGKGDGVMDPLGYITREEFFAMYGRALQLREAYEAKDAKEILTDAGYQDTAKVSDWAAGQIEILVSRNFVGGVSNTELAPQATIDRASVMALLDKSISTYVGKTATAEEAKTVEAKSEGITLIANTNTELVKGNADIVVVAAGSELFDEETQTFEHNDVRVESSSMPVARVAGENITVTVAVNSNMDDGIVTWTGVDSEIVFESGTSAKSVEAQAKGSKIIIKNGAKAESITVSETAKGATVEVAKGATTESVTVAAEDANVKVSGTVTEVKVEETAKDTTVATESTAKITTVENKAENTAVTGSGKVETVKTSEDVKVETKTAVENTNTEKAITVETKSGETVEVEKKDESASGEENKQEINGGSTPTGGGDGHTHSYNKAVDPDWHPVTVNGTKVYEYGYLCAGCNDSVSPVNKTYTLNSDWTIEHPIYVAAGQTMTIDLNGHNIIANGMDAIYNEGKLTVTGTGCTLPEFTTTEGNLDVNTANMNGYIIVKNAAATDAEKVNKNGIVNWGTLTVKQVGVVVADTYGSAIVNSGDGATTVENATVINTGLGNAIYANSGTVTLNKGTTAWGSTYGYAVFAYNESTVTVNGGSYYSTAGMPFCVCGGKLDLTKNVTVDCKKDYTKIEADGYSGEIYWVAGTLKNKTLEEGVSVIVSMEVKVDVEYEKWSSQIFHSVAWAPGQDGYYEIDTGVIPDYVDESKQYHYVTDTTIEIDGVEWPGTYGKLTELVPVSAN